MNDSEILGPFFTVILLTFAVWVYMYIRRIHFINSNDISPRDLEVPSKLAELSPAQVSNPSDNLKNLFEMPVLFYALVLYLLATSQVDGVYVWAAWTFACFRVLHSAVHCSFNLVMLRFTLYLISSLAVWFMAARAMLAALA